MIMRFFFLITIDFTNAINKKKEKMKLRAKNISQ